MSQDIVADALNQIMNIRRAEKTEVVVKRYSKVLLALLDIMKEKGHITYEVNEKERSVTVTVLRLNMCRAVKPRYFVGASTIEKYRRRFIPSRKFGHLIISTNQGLLTHQEALTQNLGGSVIAYFY